VLGDLGDLDLRFLLSWEPHLVRGRSRLLSRGLLSRGLLSRGCRCLRALSRLLGGEHSLPRDLDPDRLRFLLLLSLRSWEELLGLPERDLDLRRPWPQDSLFLLLPSSFAFFRLARSWLLEWSLEDLRLRDLVCCLLGWSSPSGGDTDGELLSPEREPEREPERVLLCSLAVARFLLAFFLPRELDVEREQEGDLSSTILWVVVCGASGLGGDSGSATVTQVTVRSSEPKKVLQGSWSLSSHGSGGHGLCAREAEPGPSAAPLPSPSHSRSEAPSAAPSPRSSSPLEEGPRGGSGSVPKTVSTV